MLGIARLLLVGGFATNEANLELGATIGADHGLDHHHHTFILHAQSVFSRRVETGSGHPGNIRTNSRAFQVRYGASDIRGLALGYRFSYCR